ncbi:MAG: FGGY-family carbohydrate kinase [Pseudomonadota bacterium]
MTNVAVIDIGKTNAKLALVDTSTLAEIAVITRPNTVLAGPPWPHFDLDGHWAFLLDGLAAFHGDHEIGAISITTHGASGVLLDKHGDLAAPMLDYEHNGPDAVADHYDAIRPAFAETGSPRLAGGLNVGAQLHWMFQTDPELRDRTGMFLTYPQYWAFRLTGVAATDVSSLGCHTDLWDPYRRRFSGLVPKLGLEGKIAPPRSAADILGPVRAEIAQQTGLSPDTPVYCGIHDSNASLYPHILAREAPFSVVSTGTWVIVMSVGATPVKLDASRDTLINVNARGDPVPSARFMGGREFETVICGQFGPPTARDASRVLQDNVMLLPAVNPDTGPFQGRSAVWRNREPHLGSGERTVGASYYLALMTATCLDLIGHAGTIIVEGPFSRNAEYCQMLSAATAYPVLSAESATGTSHGAALLAHPNAAQNAFGSEARYVETSSDMRRYAHAWRQSV